MNHLWPWQSKCDLDLDLILKGHHVWRLRSSKMNKILRLYSSASVWLHFSLPWPLTLTSSWKVTLFDMSAIKQEEQNSVCMSSASVWLHFSLPWPLTLTSTGSLNKIKPLYRLFSRWLIFEFICYWPQWNYALWKKNQELPLRVNSILITLLLETKGFKGQQKIEKII
jgi:hypothetical protein